VSSGGIINLLEAGWKSLSTSIQWSKAGESGRCWKCSSGTIDNVGVNRESRAEASAPDSAQTRMRSTPES